MLREPRSSPVTGRSVTLLLAVALVILIGATTGSRGSDSPGAAARASTVNLPASQLLLDSPSLESARARVDLASGTIELSGVALEVGDGSAIDWSDDHGGGRSFLRLLHSLMPVRDLAVLGLAGDDTAAGLGLAIVDDWRESNPRAAPADPMAWHDETTAQRLLTLVQLDRVLRASDRYADRLPDLASLMHEHAMLLLDPDFHSTGTNHGMFQDHALLAWATSAAAEGNPVARDALTTATDRLVTYLDGRISGDGVHLEHSPAYHQLIAQNMRRYGGFFAAAGDLASRAAVDSARARMLAYATHVIQPDGTFPLVGDTFTHDRPDPELFDDPAYRFAVTSGREGVAPSDTDAYFLDAGYAIMRDAWRSDGRGTYIHFSAAYHGDYHKHADDLSVWLYHDGPLLTEAGPNGYDYGDPFTVYGFGASSHNVVLVDDEGVPRTDGQTALVGLVDASRSGRVSTASGSTRRLPGVAHTRTVRYDRETSVVTIVDELTAVEPHRYTLVWHLAAGIDARPSAAGLELGRDDGRVATLRVDGPAEPSFQILRGEQREDGTVVGGWRLGGGEPSPSVTLHFDFAGEPGMTTITTTIQLAED